MKISNLKLLVLFLMVTSNLLIINVSVLKASDSNLAGEARLIAEKYWESQKTADQELFSSVSPNESMETVFSWTIVRQTEVKIEEGEIEGFRQNLLKIITSYQEMKAIRKKSLEKVTLDEMDIMYNNFNNLLKEVDTQAAEIAIQHPFLSEFVKDVQFAYLDTMIPENCNEAKTYKLMGCECIVDVELQSQAGTTLKQKRTTQLRHIIIDSYDSGWKAF